jgi:hypothetical protein
VSVVDNPENSSDGGSFDAGEPFGIEPQLLLDALAHITSDITAITDVKGLLDTVVEHCSIIGLKGAVMWTRTDDGLRLLASTGYQAHDLERFATLPLSANVPCADAVTQGRTVVCGNRDELFTAYPLTERVVGRTQALASSPVERGQQVVGGLSVHFDRQISFDDHVKSFLRSIVGLAGMLFDPGSTPLAPVLPLSVLHSGGESFDADVMAAHQPVDVDDHERYDETTGDDAMANPAMSLTERLDALERQMRTMREMLMFLGAIANDRFDDGR